VRKWLAITIIVLLFFLSCQNNPPNNNNSITEELNNQSDSSPLDKAPYETDSSTVTVVPEQTEQQNNMNMINASGKTIEERIKPPEEFERIKAEEGSFGYYLRTLPLKPHGSRVNYYDGREKNPDVHEAVIDVVFH
jgi:hypothetical protein